MITIEQIIEELEDIYGAVIKKESCHYSVTIWDYSINGYQELELLENELIELYEEYYN